MKEETKKVTLTQLLSEIKLIDSKIEGKSGRLVPVATKKGKTLENCNMTLKEFTDKIKSESDSIDYLFKRKIELKSLLIDTNNKTFVTFMGEKCSISNLLVKKEYLRSEQDFYKFILNRINSIESSISMTNDRVDREALSLIKDKTEEVNAAELMELYKTNNKRELFDPIKLKDKAVAKLEYLEEFYSNIDDELSIINATTTVEIAVLK